VKIEKVNGCWTCGSKCPEGSLPNIKRECEECKSPNFIWNK